MFRFFRRKQRLARVRIVLGEDSVLIVIENASIELERGSEVFRDGERGEVLIRGENLTFETNAFSTKAGTLGGESLF